MSDKVFPNSQIPIRKTLDLLPQVFKTEANDKFLSGVVDPLVQPGTLQKNVGFVGRRFGKTYNGKDIYLDNDQTLRSRYQLEPAVVYEKNDDIRGFYDYIDLKNQLKFFQNNSERDDLITSQDHYSWNPPIKWDKFVNFREYYWIPEGPPEVKVLGQGLGIISTYRVTPGNNFTWIFSPDGISTNPTIKLFRGQTYKFEVKSPGESFVIRSAYDTGSLIYNPILPYVPKQLAVFEGRLWRAKTFVPGRVGNTITEGEEWEIVDYSVTPSRLDYNVGVTNNGEDNGVITFEVPNDAPDVLFYQSSIYPDRFGRFIIDNIESNTKIDVEKEIIGKKNYTSSNGIEFVNGLAVTFAGQVTPAKYAKDTWIVESVGTEISLIKFTDLVVPLINKTIPDILFDDTGFDSGPFDDAAQYPAEKDYMTICRAGIDSNPWSRYNRWFHRSTLEYAHRINGTDFDAPDAARAKRPIIEFNPNIQLFNHGTIAKDPVDFVDTFTTDVFSTIEGSQGYIVDGEELFQGARILIIADSDSLANNRIYRVDFIVHNGRRQIALRATDDSESQLGQGVLVKRGSDNKGKMYHFDGRSWIKSQEKISVNQPPLFDVFDEGGKSFGDTEYYPVTTFEGSKLLSYKLGSGKIDPELKFRLSYLNIDNVGDIQFDYNFDSENFSYVQDQTTVTKNINVGFFRFNPFDRFDNGWTIADPTYAQPIIDSVILGEDGNSFELSSVNWNDFDLDNDKKIIFYLNGEPFESNYSRTSSRFTFEKSFKKNDVVSVKIFTSVIPDQGYYHIPLGLEKNPLNNSVTSFTLGQATDHVRTGLEVFEEFQGQYPGVSNLRNINGYQSRSTRFLKHNSIAPVAISMLCDKEINIIKALQYCSKSYLDFKNEFLKLSTTIEFNENVSDFVDDIIVFMGETKGIAHPFVDSDMIGSGAFTKIEYLVEDEEINVFALSERFDLESLSRRAVYVYLNQQQLIYKTDYEFDSVFGFVRILKSLRENDQIEIREYVTTGSNYIPPTPTKLGLYKKYLPRKFVDDRFVEPRVVIEGHDGSIITAYDDYRDDLLLELELRIYNNIKQNYNEDIFDIDAVIGGYYKNSIYDKTNVDEIITADFLQWVSNTDLDYTNNDDYFDSENSFTYTYSNMTDPTGTVNLPGYWRGVYRWFYDTDRPHTAPWEILGFSEKPVWWEEEYGPAPYTNGNLLLWEDIRDGVIRRGSRQGRYQRYARPTILRHIPVDGDGNLLSPLDSGLATNFTLINNKGDYKIGDVSPVENSWRSSSAYPYSIISALCLLKPFEFITDNLDRSIMDLNLLGQTICKQTRTFLKIADYSLPEIEGKQISGLMNFVIPYVRSRHLESSELIEKLSQIDVKLSSRLSGFVDQTEQKYLLDSKSPSSSSSSIFIPAENYDVFFNVSIPVKTLSYSGIIIEKVDRGWKVRGYDSKFPYFFFYRPIKSTTDPLVTVGGTSEQFVDWRADQFYGNGQLIRYKDRYYRSLKSHTSGESFDASLWKQLPQLPLVGAQQAFFRRTFDRLKPQQVSYGTIFPNVQETVDFILGYEDYLKSQGFKFDRYDPENQVAFNWGTSCKEFMFWTKHNWAIGSLLALSPSALQIDVDFNLGVADNLFDPFYDYEIYKSDGNPLLPEFVNVARDFQKLTISTVNSNDGIFFVRINFVLKEHVTIFDDRTVFNDVVYDKITGYRQERIKSRGFRTLDWDGDYTSPGFLFDNVNIQDWQPYTDYRLGDIVSYKSLYFTSLNNQFGQESFDDTKWTRLDLIPKKGLISNFDYRINQFEDYYDLDADGLGSSQRELSRHVLGFQTRDYLQNLAEDNVSQFKLYQGFIREKGTSNSITKIFDKLSRVDRDSISLNEEWAFRTGKLGGYDQFYEIEFQLRKDDFQVNPQPILIDPPFSPTDSLDRYLRVPASDFNLALIPFDKDVNPTKKFDPNPRTAGYVNSFHVQHVVKTRDDILNLDIESFENNDHIWITFDRNSWSVLRYNPSNFLVVITDIVVNKPNIVISTNRPHFLRVGDIFGIRGIENLTGFHKVTAVTNTTITVALKSGASEPVFELSSIVNLDFLIESRFGKYQNTDPDLIGALTNGSKLWIDDNGFGKWEVVEKSSQFTVTTLEDYGTAQPLKTGTSVVYSESKRQIIVGITGSDLIVVYTDFVNAIKPYQLLVLPNYLEVSARNRFGESLAVSPDGKWLAVGSPRASDLRTKYTGDYDPQQTYSRGDIVFSNGKLWRSLRNIADPDGSTLGITVDSYEWEAVNNLYVDDDGYASGYGSQGCVTLYEWDGVTYVEKYTLSSPDPQDDEKFGHRLVFTQVDHDYNLMISAPGSQQGKGRVYLYQYVPQYDNQGETITYQVVVDQRQLPDTGGFKFYLDGAYKPNLVFLVGNTYVFDQSDLSNVYYPNPTIGNITNPHPLNISADNISGEIGGGTGFTTNVRYLLDGVSVTRELYNSVAFEIAKIRQVFVTVTAATPSILYYYDRFSAGAGNSIIKRTPIIEREWKTLINHRYRGVYDPQAGLKTATEIVPGKIYTIVSLGTTDFTLLGAAENKIGIEFTASAVGTGTGLVHNLFYKQNDIVWFADSFWESLEDQDYDGSSISLDSAYWKKLDPITTDISLPTTIAIEDDGSTLDQGLLSPDQVAELIRVGDNFGFSLAASTSGEILVVGAPNSDGQYFAGYKGAWRPFQTYRQGDVVRYKDTSSTDPLERDIYYRLEKRLDIEFDSATESLNQKPDRGLPWQEIGDSSTMPSGKVFVYKKNSSGSYDLFQTISAASLYEISNLTVPEVINSGDNFGYAVDIDSSGTTIVASSPRADLELLDQGSVFVFKLDTDSTSNQFRLTQKLTSLEAHKNEQFGSTVAISNRTERIVVGASNTPYKVPVIFDSGVISFDKRTTSFNGALGYPGQVYVFELKDHTYLLTEKLQTDITESESFGSAIDITADIVVVGSPSYLQDGIEKGKVRLFRKQPGINSWTTIAEEQEKVDIEKLKSVILIDGEKNVKISDIDIIDPNKGKILGLAEQEISFKTPYDPATYTNGNDSVLVEPDQAWFEKNVGKLWWNTSTVKWVEYEQGDVSYRAGNWNQLAVGASIDIYEWVESSVSPADWSKLADTADGLSDNISGTPLYGSSVYSIKQFFNSATGQILSTRYYFWVKNKTTIPTNNSTRKISAFNVANLIENPISNGSPILAIIDSDKFLTYNFKEFVSGELALLNLEYYKTNINRNPVHNEYQLLTEGSEDSLPSQDLEQKWLDSLVGFSLTGEVVPDPRLPIKQKYGISFRPIQTMFADRMTALKIVIDRINTVFSARPFADVIDFVNLNQVDDIPDQRLNLYDLSVDTIVDRDEIGTVRLKRATLRVNIINGSIDSIDVIDPGFGYRSAPTIEISGDGVGAQARLQIDNQGRVISSVEIVNRGKKYSYAEAIVRPFSVLVVSDSSYNNFWSVYSWDETRKQYFRSRTQAYDTKRYWNLVDWYAQGVTASSRIVRELANLNLEPIYNFKTGDILKVKEYGSGGWALLQRVETDGDILGKYKLVGREKGTIQLSSSLYDTKIYDTIGSYDELPYDVQPTQELRFIFKAVKENVFTEDLAVEWNKLFFASIRYIFSEQLYVDWAFKTSFLNAVHKIGELEEKLNYKNDNLESFKQYIDEIKPFRTTVREFVSDYTKLEIFGSPTTDFDNPPSYSVFEGKIIPIDENNSLTDTYPWKFWKDNKFYSIDGIEISHPGSGYVSPPRVVIEGDGSGASAQAYVSNGRVISIKITNPGSGYSRAPSVLLVGGNGFSTDLAKAVAYIGSSNVRSFDLSLRFDRITKTGIYSNFVQREEITADGLTSVFDLKYPPSRNKTKVTVTKNSEILLKSDYEIIFYESNTSGFDILKARVKFTDLPEEGDVLIVEYEKNQDLYDSVDRINKLYNPRSGMIGKDIGQLMTGIDFGGVIIQGTTFDVSGGWDALPWFTDNWDSVQPNSDFYVQTDGSTNTVTLPYVPAQGQLISVYLKRKNSDKTIRIDDPEFDSSLSVTRNQNAVMPSFIGDGVNNVINIGDYLRTEPDDTLIFRTAESDGTLNIDDINIIDTQLSGGSLPESMGSAYSTATGTNAEDIIIEGGKFIGPDQVPAPEENIPGQVIDSVSIKVFHTTFTGAAPIQSSVFVSNGNRTRYPIGLSILEPQSLLVFVDQIKYETQADSSLIEYLIDYNSNEIEFSIAPRIGSKIEIVSLGIGGAAILDYQEFEADGETNLFLTRAFFRDTQSIVVTVDGIQIDAVYTNSTGTVDTAEKTLIQIGVVPPRRSIVKIVCLGAALDTDSTGQSLIRVNRQLLSFDGSTRVYELDKFVNLSRSSALGSVLVEVNGRQLNGPDTIVFVYDGTNNVVKIGRDPAELSEAANRTNIKVYVNNNLIRYITDYSYSFTTKTVTIQRSAISVGDEVKIEVDLTSDYLVQGNDLVIKDSVSLSPNDDIVVTWFSEYPSFDITSDQYSGGRSRYILNRTPISADYVWVYSNGQRLTKDIDYEVLIQEPSIILKDSGKLTDTIKIVQYGQDIKRKPVAFEISKDMLNLYRYKRFSINKAVSLSEPLNYYDTSIKVTDDSQLFVPLRDKNIPGVVFINGEKIEYFVKSNNVLSQLRRGAHGTSIAETYPAGTSVVDLSPKENLPYNESQERQDFVSDGSSLLIGPLDFVPTRAARNTSWFRGAIPSEYGACDEIEVFVGGSRLRKDPIVVFDEDLGATSPEADKSLEPDFTVDGTTPFFRLTQTPPAGTRITVIRRIGKTWYDRGENTVSAGKTLVDNQNPILRFVTEKTSELPE